MKFTTKTEEIKLNKINLMTEEQKEKRKKIEIEYYKNNKDRIKENSKKYYENNKDRIKENSKKYYENNKDVISERSKQYRETNKIITEEEKQKKKIYQKQYRENNKNKIKEKNIEYRKNNKEKIIKTQKEFRERNKIKLKEYQREYMKKRLKLDILFKIKQNIRSLISNSIKLKGLKKNSKTENILGCTFDEFKIHIESKFESWMNWNNQGNPVDGILEFNKTWDIDHIIPISNAKTEEEVIKINHYTNFQPLCSKINRQIKQNKLDF